MQQEFLKKNLVLINYKNFKLFFIFVNLMCLGVHIRV